MAKRKDWRNGNMAESGLLLLWEEMNGEQSGFHLIGQERQARLDNLKPLETNTSRV